MFRFPSRYVERAIVFGLGIACLVIIAFTAFNVSDRSIPLTIHRAELLRGAERQPPLHVGLDWELAASTGTSAILYAFYEPRILQLKQPIVLFFWKATDPFSRQHDMLIQSLVAAQVLRIATYRVAFDSGTGARLAFGVVVPDTFVLLDAQGQRTSLMIHPTADDVRALLTVTHP